MPTIKSTELALLMDTKPEKVKRHVREFVGYDPNTGRQKGYARELSLEDAFDVYLGGEILDKLGFSIPESRKILEDIKPWMKKRHLYPPTLANREQQKKSPVKGWTILIFRLEQGHFYYEAMGRLPVVEHNGQPVDGGGLVKGETVDGIEGGTVSIEKVVFDPWLSKREREKRPSGRYRFTEGIGVERRLRLSGRVGWFTLMMMRAGMV
jgi:hypothetical protein